MTQIEAQKEINNINMMLLEDVQRLYDVNSKEEIIALILEEVEEETIYTDNDIYNENGFSNSYYCNAYLY